MSPLLVHFLPTFDAGGSSGCRAPPGRPPPADGATEDLPSFAQAGRELEAARSALLAQRDGLIRRDSERRQAQAIVSEADRRLIELEGLYGRARKNADKSRVPELLSLMRSARQAGSGLVLLY